MAGFNYPGLLSDWTDGMDPQDPRMMPQGLLAALSQGQSGPAPMSNVPTMDGAQSPLAAGFQPFAQSAPQPVPQPAPPMPNARPSQFDLPANITPAYRNAMQLEGAPSPDLPAQGAVPAGGAPFNGQPSQTGGSEEPGMFQKLVKGLGGVYGQGGPGDGLINLGLALMSPGNKAENLMRAGQMGQMADYKKSQLMAAQQKQQREQMALQGNMQTLKQAYPNWSQEQLAAAAQSPQIVQAAVQRMNPNEQFAYETDGEGNTWKVNKNNNDRSIVQSSAKPQLVEVPQADGTVRREWITPGQARGTVVGGDVQPPAVDPKTLATERARQQVKHEGETQDRERAATLVMPHLDRAEKSYRKLGEMNAIGPFAASGINRTLGGSFGTDAEVARQDYEASAKELELLKAQIQMKGQGQISNSERAILGMTLPRLDAADPKTGMETLRILRQQFTNTGAGQQGGQAPQQPAQPAAPKRYKYDASGNLVGQ